MSKTNPDHYKLPSGLEAFEVTRHFDFPTGNAIKYLWRAGRKDGESSLDDLLKAKWYLDKLIEGEENGRDTNREDISSSINGNVHLCPSTGVWELDEYYRTQGS